MKHKRLKSLICILLVFVMTASVFSGCASKEKETEEESSTEEETEKDEAAEEPETITFPLDEPVEFTSFSIATNQYELKDSLAFQEACARANIVIDIEHSVVPQESPEKANLLAASGEYPDVFFKPGNIDADKMGEDGVLIPVQDLIREYMPNLSAHLDERNAWNTITSPDGNIYKFPSVWTSTINSDGLLWINQVWLDNLGLDVPTDMESLYNVLKAFKEQDADGDGDPNNEVPITFYGDANEHGNCVPAVIYALYQEDMFADMTYLAEITDSNDLEFYANTDWYKEGLQWMKKLYDEGIMDPSSFTQKGEDAIAKYTAANNVGCFPSYAPNGFVSDEFAMEFIALRPFNEKGGRASTGISSTGVGAAITDKCENPEVFAAWLDYFYCEEGAILADMGIEGVTYTLNEDGSYDYIFDLGECYGKPKDVIQGGATCPMKVSDLRWKVNPETSPALALAYEQRNAVYAQGTIVPAMSLNQEEKDATNDRWTEVKNYVSTYTAEVVTGVVSLEDSWDEYVKTLENMGVAEIFEYFNAAFDRVYE